MRPLLRAIQPSRANWLSCLLTLSRLTPSMEASSACVILIWAPDRSRPSCCTIARSSSRLASRWFRSKNAKSANASSVRRTRRLSVSSSANIALGRSASHCVKSSRRTTSVFVRPDAIALADRGLPSSKARSPTHSPGPNRATVASSPLRDATTIRTPPSITIWSASPGSPSWKMAAPLL